METKDQSILKKEKRRERENSQGRNSETLHVNMYHGPLIDQTPKSLGFCSS